MVGSEVSCEPVSPISVAPGDQRAAERIDVGLPYMLDGGTQGHTRDLSATGLSFESAVPHQVGAIVKMTVRLRRPFFDPPG